jgi:hypothetical protein
MSSDKFEERFTMIERGWFPHRGRMTIQTLVGQLPGHMVRRGGLREFLLVTRIAIIRQTLVLLIHMAFGAFSGTMRPLQRIIRLRMIEGGWFPDGGRMARETILRELSFHMVRCRQCSDILLMTGITILGDR